MSWIGFTRTNDVYFEERNDYLPRWAKDEAVYNCEGSWGEVRGNIFIGFLKHLFG